MRKALTGIVLSLALSSAALAGSFSSGLDRYVAGRSSQESIKVLLSLKEQAQVAELDQQLRDGKATLAERHERVISALMNTATRSQGELLHELATLKAAGKVNGFTPYWITNAIVVNAPIAVLRQLAAREDVAVAEVDLVVDAIMPVLPSKGLQVVPGSGQRVITSGLAAINADDVWTLLGVNGTGALVGGIDTGVDGTHGALSGRWRGNNGHPTAECWLDAAGLGHTTPTDGHGHGTHTMGTMVGGAPGDDVGVAPGAQWIATNCINMGTGSPFDNAVIASFQFMADPDGNAGTIDDVPDVVQNSWGVNEGFSGYVDCDTRWWAAIDNCEAAGVCVTFSAGNEGSGAGTLRSPGDRAVSPFSCFSVGATDPDLNNEIAYFSSRGPSTCTGGNGAYPIKPEVSAPGVDTYSAYPGGGYTTMSGTSMAGPHVAGVVALMRSANPNVDVSTIKQILMDTSVEVASDGTPGDDNTFGHGLIDAYQAVLAVMSGYGTLTGTVTSASSGLPLSGVTVQNTAGPQAVTTNGLGGYTMMLAEGAYTLSYSAFGYVAQNQNVSVVADATTTRNVALASAPSAVLSGVVYGPDSNPVVGAVLDFTNAPIADVTTGAGGFYSVTIPTGFTYAITASAAGVGSQSQNVVFNGASTVNFNLPINPQFLPSGPDSYGYRIFDSNDTGGVPVDWTDIAGTGTPQILSDDSYVTVAVPFNFNFYGTSYSQLSVGSNGYVVCGATGNSTYSNGSMAGLVNSVAGMWDDLNPGAGGTVYTQALGDRFIVQWENVSYFGGGGTVRFQIVLLNPASFPSQTGDAQWLMIYQNGDRTSHTTGISSPTGTSFLDYNVNGAYDLHASPFTAPIALLFSTNENGFGPVSYPDVAVSPLSLSKTLVVGTTGSDAVTIGNSGEGNLFWNATVATFGLASSVPYLELAKGQDDPRQGSFDRAAGGPDAFGYSWKDSNEAGGPVYSWVDISSIGTEVGTGDDYNFGPYNLGFTFDFYGNPFSAVRVCTNGWLSFSSTYTTYTNQGIPTTGEPENLLAAFWDDLLPSTAGSIKYYADAANERFIVSYFNVPRYSNSAALETFQVILHADGRIVYQYQTVSDVQSATVGIENAAGTDGLQVVFNAAYLTNSLAIQFEAAAPWLSIAPTGGTVAPGGSGVMSVDYNATDTPVGVYSGQVTLTCNDPDTPTIVIPVGLNVIAFALGQVDLSIEYVGGGVSQLTWPAVPGATSYDVYQAPYLGGSFSLVANTVGTSFNATAAGNDLRLFQVVARAD